ncbi:ABC transporter permease [soil metagenome]
MPGGAGLFLRAAELTLSPACMPQLSLFDLGGYGHLLIEGSVITVTVGIAAMAVALMLGILGALARLSPRRWLRNIGATYATVVRGVPELVLMLIVYYGGTMLLQMLLSLGGGDVRVDINAFLAGTIVLGFVYGAYATEIFRGAFLAIPHGQIDAARAFGMSGFTLLWRIQLPQAWRLAIPGLGNLWLTLLKATSITSVIGLTELARQADLVKSPTHKPFTTFFLASLLYLAMTAVSDVLRIKVERWASAGFRRI